MDYSHISNTVGSALVSAVAEMETIATTTATFLCTVSH